MGYFSIDGAFYRRHTARYSVSITFSIHSCHRMISRVVARGVRGEDDAKKLRVICLRDIVSRTNGRIFLVHETPPTISISFSLVGVCPGAAMVRVLHLFCMKRCKTLSRWNNIARRCVARTSSSFLRKRIVLV